MNFNLTDTQKKVLYVTAMLVVAAFFGFLIYVLFFKAPKEEYVNINGNMVPITVFPEINLNLNIGVSVENVNAFEGIPAISSVANGGNTLAETILPEAAQDATLAANGQDMQYYNAEDGKFYTVNADGEIVSLSDEAFKGVEKVNWSNNSNQAVLEFQDGYNLYYDFQKKQQYTLPKEMEEFTFSPNNDKIGYKYMALDEEDRWLGTINPDGSDPKGIERLGENGDKVQVSWSPSGKAIATYNDYMDGDRQKVIPIGLNGENYKQMTVEGRDFNYQWSPDGKQMIYSVFGSYSDFKPTLWVVDAEGDAIGNNRVPLEIDTWVDKCTFGTGSTAYCAVPNDLPTGAGYNKDIANDTPDSIYKIDIKTGTKSLIAVPTSATGTSAYTVDSMNISADGTYLYFTDKAEKNIHKIKLK
ncbi:MAG: hypothetical protein WC752_02025 [Patescibacteria group bacterium]|jgi:hypothetical protein